MQRRPLVQDLLRDIVNSFLHLYFLISNLSCQSNLIILTSYIYSPLLISTNPGYLSLFYLNIPMKIFINSGLTTRIMNFQTSFPRHREHLKVRTRDKKTMLLVKENLSPGSQFPGNIHLKDETLKS